MIYLHLFTGAAFKCKQVIAFWKAQKAYMYCFTARCVARWRSGSLCFNIKRALTRKPLALLLANNKGKQQRGRPACTSVQSDQRLCYSLSEK